MPAPDSWLFAPHIALHRGRQSLSHQEHGRMLALLQPGHPAGRRILDLRDAMFAGEKVNASEQRAAGHWALRLAGHPEAGLDHAPSHRFAPEGEDLIPKMQEVHRRMVRAVASLRHHEQLSSSGLPYRDVIHLGIGGSDLGPQLLIAALGRPEVTAPIRPHFLANLDYHGVQHVLAQCNPRQTLLVMVSKSFTTQETTHNAHHVLQWMRNAGVQAPERDCIAVTAKPERARQWAIPDGQIFWFDESIGGRYSLWGPVSFTARLALGNACVDEFNEGGLAMDAHVLAEPLTANMPAVLAATDFYNLRTRGIPTLMVSAYDSRLGLLVPYLKQLWMESLGKHIDRDGRPLDGPACPILWGDVGTTAQHAFFQLLHQGAQGVAVELIASIQPEHQAVDSHHALLSNLIAQAQALAMGHAQPDMAKTCWGGHPVNVMLLDQLNPQGLGALIALWEYRVLSLAALQNLNPFDQWGVELGKSIAQSAMAVFAQRGGQADAPKVPREDLYKNTPALDDTSRSIIQWLLDQR